MADPVFSIVVVGLGFSIIRNVQYSLKEVYIYIHCKHLCMVRLKKRQLYIPARINVIDILSSEPSVFCHVIHEIFVPFNIPLEEMVRVETMSATGLPIVVLDTLNIPTSFPVKGPRLSSFITSESGK